MKTNYIKIFTYLKQFERMNPRYLWADTELINGNYDVFYGLLDDIWHLTYNKISIYDKRSKNKNSESKSMILKYEQPAQEYL